MSVDAFELAALALLREGLNDPEAEFRPGQLEAIRKTVQERKRILVVQRTGWGKSIVYFVATRLLLKGGCGPTIIISPLLALMRDQIRQATAFGVRARAFNSSTYAEHEDIADEWRRGALDLLFTTPEQLGRSDFYEAFFGGDGPDVGLFVVDEAHCISDWGHDFRPDYQRVKRILQRLPAGIPVMATTATANGRVCGDVIAQLGHDLELLRGEMSRPGLRLRNLHIPDKAERMAWLVEHLPAVPGSGVIYTLTKHDADQIADWLSAHSICAHAYHSGVADAERRCLEEALLDNRIKVLVATSAFGMGVDKPDLQFVIHFQHPGSVIHYYQQVGRAGRAVSPAYGVMLCGEEDPDILNHFIRQAFPSAETITEVLDALAASEDGLTIRELEQYVQAPYGRIEHALCFLSVESPTPVLKPDRRDGKWRRLPGRYSPDRERIERVTQARRDELEQMRRYQEHGGCLMQFLCEALSDTSTGACRICANCAGRRIARPKVPDKTVLEARTFLKRRHRVIQPRLKWVYEHLALFEPGGTIPKQQRAEEGRALCLWGDAGWGDMARRNKEQDGRFAEELVEASVDFIVQEWIPDPFPQWVTSVPSLNRPELVRSFARALAAGFGLPYMDAVRKTRATSPQKTMQNSYQQLQNVRDAFGVSLARGTPNGPVLLVDDMIDSRWTMTVIAARLRHAGSGPVYPFAIAEMPKGGS